MAKETQDIMEYVENQRAYQRLLHESIIAPLQNGVVTVTFRVYRGKVTDIVKNHAAEKFTIK